MSNFIHMFGNNLGGVLMYTLLLLRSCTPRSNWPSIFCQKYFTLTEPLQAKYVLHAWEYSEFGNEVKTDNIKSDLFMKNVDIMFLYCFI